MRIKIIGFKCHLEAEYNFTDNQMTLIKGSSGQGKTSILQAIFWCLYGNMRSIYNNARITKNLSVMIQLSNLTIHRKKNPELLTVTVFTDSKINKDTENTYQDAVAQTIIDSYLGNREVWKACSYIEQQSRCSLLSGSSSERMELLNALSFTGENPKDYIHRINEKLKEITNSFTVNQSSFVTEINLYSSEIENKTIQTLDAQGLKDLEKKIIELEQQEQLDYQEVCNFERLQGTYSYLEKSYQTLLDSQIEEPKSPREEELILESESEIPQELYLSQKHPEIDQNTIISYSDYSLEKTKLIKEITFGNSLIEEKDRLQKDLEIADQTLNLAQAKILEIPNINQLINTEIKPEQIWAVSQIEYDRLKNLEQAKKLGLEYDQNIIRNTLSQLTETLTKYTNLEKHLSNYRQLLTVEEKINNLRKDQPLSVNQLEKLFQEQSLLISELKKGLELLSCPNCKIPLRYRGGNLSLGEREPVSSSEISQAEQEYRKLEQLLKSARELLNFEEKASWLNSSLEGLRDDLEKYLKEGSKIKDLSDLISKISSIKVIDNPELSSETLSSIAAFQKAYYSKEQLLSSLNSIKIPEGLDDLRQRLENLEKQYQLEQERIKKNQNLTTEYQKRESERLNKLSRLEQEQREIRARNQVKREKHSREIQEKSNKFQRDKEKYQTLKIRLETEKKELEDKKAELQLKTNVKEKHLETRKEIETKKQLLERAIYGNKMVIWGQELEKKRNNLLELQKDMEALTRLKMTAIQVECKQLEDTVNNINTILESTLPIFFNEPISLRLLLYKKVKKDMKPGLNLEISYKGFKYENINNLSGGEGDRISLALLLALNSVSNSPILLLDECVSSLDAELKESCITAIKSIPNKTVICVDHDDSLEGFYDSVLAL